MYARIDYLDPNAKVTKDEKDFVPGDSRKESPGGVRVCPDESDSTTRSSSQPITLAWVTVSYPQHAYADTRGSGSYQLAYVLHPATLWREFGPIHVTVQVPKWDTLQVLPQKFTTQARGDRRLVSRVSLGRGLRQACDL